MPRCPICQLSLDSDSEPVWAHGGEVAHLVCIDATAAAILHARQSGNAVVKGIAEVLFKSARELMVREQAHPDQLRLV